MLLARWDRDPLSLHQPFTYLLTSLSKRRKFSPALKLTISGLGTSRFLCPGSSLKFPLPSCYSGHVEPQALSNQPSNCFPQLDSFIHSLLMRGTHGCYMFQVLGPWNGTCDLAGDLTRLHVDTITIQYGITAIQELKRTDAEVFHPGPSLLLPKVMAVMETSVTSSDEASAICRMIRFNETFSIVSVQMRRDFVGPRNGGGLSHFYRVGSRG